MDIQTPSRDDRELRGVTLAEIAAEDAAYKETRAALEEHSVLVFRGQFFYGQDVTDEAQLAVARRFGPIAGNGPRLASNLSDTRRRGDRMIVSQ